MMLRALRLAVRERRRVDATVVERPFFDPERKRFTPAATKKKEAAP